MYYVIVNEDELSHSGVIGQKWGERRYQYSDGSLTPAGRAHYGVGPPRGSKAGSTNKATRKRVTDAGGSSSGGSGSGSGGSSGGSSNGSRTTPSGRVLSDEDSRRLADMRKNDPEFKRLGEEMDKAEREYQSLAESDNAPRKKLEESEAKYKKAKEDLIAYRDKKLDEPANKSADNPSQTREQRFDQYLKGHGNDPRITEGIFWAQEIKERLDSNRYLSKKSREEDQRAYDSISSKVEKWLDENDAKKKSSPDDKKAGSLFSKRQKETTGKSQEEIIQDIVDHGGVRDIANNMGKMSTDQLRAAKSRLEATQELRRQIKSEDYEKVDNFINAYSRVGSFMKVTGEMANNANKVATFVSNVSKLAGKNTPELDTIKDITNVADKGAKAANKAIDKGAKALGEAQNKNKKSDGSDKKTEQTINKINKEVETRERQRPENIVPSGFDAKDVTREQVIDKLRIEDDTVPRSDLTKAEVKEFFKKLRR